MFRWVILAIQISCRRKPSVVPFICSSLAFPTLQKCALYHQSAYLSQLPLGHWLPDCCCIWYLSIDRKKRCETRIADHWPREVSGSGLVSVKDLSVTYHLLLKSSWRLEVLASENRRKDFSRAIMPVCPDQLESISYLNIHQLNWDRDEDIKAINIIYELLNQLLSIFIYFTTLSDCQFEIAQLESQNGNN